MCVEKEAEPVNGELAGFLPLGTSAALLFMWTLSSTATARPKAAGAAPRASGGPGVAAAVSSVISVASSLSVK